MTCKGIFHDLKFFIPPKIFKSGDSIARPFECPKIKICLGQSKSSNNSFDFAQDSLSIKKRRNLILFCKIRSLKDTFCSLNFHILENFWDVRSCWSTVQKPKNRLTIRPILARGETFSLFLLYFYFSNFFKGRDPVDWLSRRPKDRNFVLNRAPNCPFVIYWCTYISVKYM